MTTIEQAAAKIKALASETWNMADMLACMGYRGNTASFHRMSSQMTDIVDDMMTSDRIAVAAAALLDRTQAALDKPKENESGQ